MIPVSWSTYSFSVSMRSINGFDFLGFPSAEGEEGRESPGVIGVVGVKGTTRPSLRPRYLKLHEVKE